MPKSAIKSVAKEIQMVGWKVKMLVSRKSRLDNTFPVDQIVVVDGMLLEVGVVYLVGHDALRLNLENSSRFCSIQVCSSAARVPSIILSEKKSARVLLPVPMG